MVQVADTWMVAAEANAYACVCAGPGRAWDAKEQGQYLFKLAGKKERFISAPVGLMDGVISCFDGLTRFFPGLEVSFHLRQAFAKHSASLLCSECHSSRDGYVIELVVG